MSIFGSREDIFRESEKFIGGKWEIKGTHSSYIIIKLLNIKIHAAKNAEIFFESC